MDEEKSIHGTNLHRRKLMNAVVGTFLVGCKKEPDWCSSPLLTSDGDFPTVENCKMTVEEIEGPYYLSDAPERNNLNIFDDAGTVIRFSGQVFQSNCNIVLAGAYIEFWHADPEGKYDNTSEEMKYRCRIKTDEDGFYEFRSLMPGRYKNGTTYRPRHIHVKVFDPQGTELITTQLYFKGDPYLNCDEFAHTSNVVDFIGDETVEVEAVNVHFIVS